MNLCTSVEGHLEFKILTIWTDGKAEVGRVREERRGKKGDQNIERVRKKMQVREKVSKSRNTLFFQCSEGQEVGK